MVNSFDPEINLTSSVENVQSRRITRSELYAKIWSEPMVKIAKEFGISDRGLAKIC